MGVNPQLYSLNLHPIKWIPFFINIYSISTGNGGKSGMYVSGDAATWKQDKEVTCSPHFLIFALSGSPWEQISLMMGWSTTDWIPLKEGMLIWRILSPLSLKNGKEHQAQWTNSYFKSTVCYQHILQTVTFSPTGPHRHCSCVLLV